MTEVFFEGHGYVTADVALAILISISAILTYARLAFEEGSLRMPIARLVVAMGFTLLAIRFWASLYIGVDVTVPPLSMIAMSMICGGYCSIQIRGIRRAIAVSKVNVLCFRNPEFKCMRDDRIEEALRNARKGLQ